MRGRTYAVTVRVFQKTCREEPPTPSRRWVRRRTDETGCSGRLVGYWLRAAALCRVERRGARTSEPPCCSYRHHRCGVSIAPELCVAASRLAELLCASMRAWTTNGESHVHRRRHTRNNSDHRSHRLPAAQGLGGARGATAAGRGAWKQFEAQALAWLTSSRARIIRHRTARATIVARSGTRITLGPPDGALCAAIPRSDRRGKRVISRAAIVPLS